MMSHRCRTLLLFLWITAAACTSFALAADSAPAPQTSLVATGGPDILWISVGPWDETAQAIANRLYYREPGTDRTVAAVEIRPQLKRPARWAVAGKRLHVFYEARGSRQSSSAHMWYAPHHERRAHQLPGNVLPLALAGESGASARLWALVDAGTARQVGEAAEQRRAASRPASQPAPTEASASLPSPEAEQGARLALVSYDAVSWEAGPLALPDCGSPEQAWLCTDGRRHVLFWQVSASEPAIRSAMYVDGQWIMLPAIEPLGTLQQACSGVVNRQIVFAALTRQPSGQELVPVQWSRSVAAAADQPWNALPALTTAAGPVQTLPEGSLIALFADRVALLRPGPPPDLALWASSAGGKPEQPFTALPAHTARGSRSGRGVRDLVSMIVVAVLVLLIFWRRQESVGVPLPMPVGLLVVGPAKRGLAFLVDALPAAAIIAALYWTPLNDYYQESQLASSAREPVPDLPSALVWASIWFRLLYVGWCIFFEMAISATPGKRLLGCQVLSETLERPTPTQVVIRNLAKLVELEPMLQVWPFLLVIFFTRNRQRLGDLLVRTIVVERRAVFTAPPPPSPGE